MSRFDRMTVKGFRRLLDLDLALNPLTVVIGANGVGKSSLLDVFSLLSASASGGLNQRLTDFGGLGAVLTLDHADSLTLGLSMEAVEGAPLEYTLRLASRGQSYGIESEILSQQKNITPPPFYHIQARFDDIRYYDVGEKAIKKQGAGVKPTWVHNAQESALAQVPRMFQLPESFRNALSSSRYFHALNVSPRSPVRLPQPMFPAKHPGSDGENLVSCLYTLRETDPERFGEIEATLQTAFPGFGGMQFPPAAAGMLSLSWKDRNFTRPLYAHQLSEGTLRFLWLTTLLYSSEPSRMILLDEPEVSLHPEWLNLLGHLLRDASRRSQILVATHSDRLVGYLKPEEVVIMDIDEEGMTTATPAEQLDLAHWLTDYSLDELWRMGVLGGRS
ncbi:MAG: AAA family ATPase [Magnetococcales bacterium]|nr:AAA family ATPase [Magnetococcales bacterium]